MALSEIESISLSPAVLDAIRRNRKIEAIKHLREERKLGLKEAKEIIDVEFERYREVHGIERPAGPGLGWIVLIIAVILLIFLFFR